MPIGPKPYATAPAIASIAGERSCFAASSTGTSRPATPSRSVTAS